MERLILTALLLGAEEAVLRKQKEASPSCNQKTGLWQGLLRRGKVQGSARFALGGNVPLEVTLFEPGLQD